MSGYNDFGDFFSFFSHVFLFLSYGFFINFKKVVYPYPEGLTHPHLENRSGLTVADTVWTCCSIIGVFTIPHHPDNVKVYTYFINIVFSYPSGLQYFQGLDVTKALIFWQNMGKIKNKIIQYWNSRIYL